MPLFRHKPLSEGERYVILHCFGGTYGPAKFLLTAAEQAMIGTIHITLMNKWGSPIASIPIESEITLEDGPFPPPLKRKDEWLAEGQALANLKRYKEALAAYNQAHHLNPNDVIAYTYKAIALVNLERYEEALVACNQALLIDPSYALAYNNKGSAFERLGKKRDAEQARKRARQLRYRR